MNCELTVHSGWTALALSMMAAGLAKGEGPEVMQVLTRSAQAFNGRDLAAEAWGPRRLAVMGGALAKGTGPDVDQALNHLALMIRDEELSLARGWTAQDLGAIAASLVRCEGSAVQDALRHLARAVCGRRLTESAGWVPRHLALVLYGVGSGAGAAVDKALIHLARAVSDRELSVQAGWKAKPLAMLACGLCRGRGHGRGRDIQKALTHLARALLSRDLQAEAWNAQDLSMMAGGLARGEGHEVQQALRQLVAAVRSGELASARLWTGQNLAVMLGAIGQTLSGDALFDQLVRALAERAGPEPDALIEALDALSRFSLSARHLQAAWQLLEALEKAPLTAVSPQAQETLLWSTTLCHFASCQSEPADLAQEASFARAYQRCLTGPVGKGPGKAARGGLDLWHVCWARAYWEEPAVRMAVGGQVPSVADAEVPAPYWQRQVFDYLSKELAGHDLQMEVGINAFPVDMVIDGQVCVEVDGPDHFVRVPAAAGPQGAPVLVAARRTKDQFVDHMLRRSGYQVLRITDAQERAALQALVSNIRALLDAPVKPEPAAGQERNKA